MLRQKKGYNNLQQSTANSMCQPQAEAPLSSPEGYLAHPFPNVNTKWIDYAKTTTLHPFIALPAAGTGTDARQDLGWWSWYYKLAR